MFIEVTQSVLVMHFFIHRALKGAVMTNFGAVKGPEGVVVSGKRSCGGLAGPGNPDFTLAGVAV
jgi:hypothetical protein